MTAYDIIMKKRRGYELSQSEIDMFIEGYVNGDIPDYQMSALLMAICFSSMTSKETAALTMAMLRSGDTLSPSAQLGGFCVDKHSTGGVGDKTTLIALPVCAACGVYAPKMSGRGLGHTGGTIDKLEAIPGLKTSLDREEFAAAVKQAGFAITSQSDRLVQADKMIYALRSATATVDSLPLICSSVMSKKLATGADGIVLDVKFGDGAFMKTADDAKSLAKEMISVGKLLGRKCTAVISDMSKPLGMAVGNSIEVIEAVNALKGECDPDLFEVSITLAAQMLFLAGKGCEEECRALAEEAIYSGRALAAFEKMVRAQGGNTNVLSDYSLFKAPEREAAVYAASDGYISGIACEKTGLIAMALGAGRKTKEGSIDSTAGILFARRYGDYVKKGDMIATLMTSSECDLELLCGELEGVFSYSPAPPAPLPAVAGIVR